MSVRTTVESRVVPPTTILRLVPRRARFPKVSGVTSTWSPDVPSGWKTEGRDVPPAC